MVEHQPSKLNTWVRFPSPAFLVKKFNLRFKQHFCNANNSNTIGCKMPMVFYMSFYNLPLDTYSLI